MKKEVPFRSHFFIATWQKKIIGEFFFFGVFLETRRAKEEEREEEEETERDTDERRERNVRAGSARRLSAELFCLFESVGTFLLI